MRISDWSSDVCSSDLRPDGADRPGGWPAHGGRHLRRRLLHGALRHDRHPLRHRAAARDRRGTDRKSVVWGKSVSVRVDLGVLRKLKKKNNLKLNRTAGLHWKD